MITALIVSGGRSTRIGRDKKFLEVGGRVFVEIAADVAKEVADEVIIVVGSMEQMQETEALGLEGVKIIADVKEGQGPVMGILTGLHAARGELAIVMPTDAPMMKADILKHMLDEREGYNAVVPKDGERLEPLLAVYGREAMIDACTWALDVEGEKASMQNIVRGLGNVKYIPLEDFKKFDETLLTFYNVNTAEDLEEVLKSIK